MGSTLWGVSTESLVRLVGMTVTPGRPFGQLPTSPSAEGGEQLCEAPAAVLTRQSTRTALPAPVGGLYKLARRGYQKGDIAFSGFRFDLSYSDKSAPTPVKIRTPHQHPTA